MRICRTMFPNNTHTWLWYDVDLLKDYDSELVTEFYESVFSFIEKYSIREPSDLNVLFNNWELSTILAVEMHEETRCVIDMPLIALPIKYKKYKTSAVKRERWLYHLELSTSHHVPTHVYVDGSSLYSASPFNGYAVVGHGNKIKLLSTYERGHGALYPNRIKKI